jgi:hypothetical protein
MGNNFYNILIAVGLLILLIFMRDCSNSPEQVIVKTTDTLTVTHIDTLWQRDTIENIIVIHKPDTIYVDSANRTISVYNESITDTMIEGTVTAEVEGTLVGLKLNYVPLFPKYINRIDSIIVTNTEKIYPEFKSKVFLGGSLGGGINNFQLSPMIAIKNKNDLLMYYQYDIISGSHFIGMAAALKNPFKSKLNE